MGDVVNMPMTRTHKIADGHISGQTSGGASLPQGISNSSDEARLADQSIACPPIAAPAAHPPLLISDSQLANRHSFNFATKKTKFGMKCISLPAHDIAAELAKREPNQARVRALRDELLAFAVAEFHRWEARIA